MPIKGLFVFIFILLSQSVVVAGALDPFERLVMPGKLSSAHAKYEKDCAKCHKKFKKGGQSDLCLDCHKEINKDVRGKKGLHGKITDINTRKCSSCHHEHNGRSANIVPFDRDTFDHNRTNFELHGTHSRLSCADCHDSKKKYRKASKECEGCHKKDDAHHKRLGKQCKDCHVETIWGEAYYNHEKTDFPLKAMHRNVRCIECHPNERYKNTPKTCVTCHRLDDVHEGNNGKKCEKCHKEQMWSEVVFDHDKDTKYKLENRHAAVDCQACHKGDVYKKIKHECYVCHKSEDAHNKLFGKKCKACHVTKSWTKITFKHDQDTDYVLKGKHKKVACIACHPGDVYAELETACINCHKQDDAHEGQEGDKCEQCHNENSWDDQVFFDHDLTAFPLLDAHAITACEECHLSSVYQDAGVECKDCHMKDDRHFHKKRLGLNCELCHNANSWRKWFFDHDKQTDYKLDGAHLGLECHACHHTVVKKEIELDSKCVSCHEADDHHNGSFGPDCERCHVTDSFKNLRLRK